MDNKLVIMLSCNVRGLHDTVFNGTIEIEQIRNKEWPGLPLYNHGENNARGTMIAFKPHIKPFIYNTIHDDHVQYIILDCTFFKH